MPLPPDLADLHEYLTFLSPLSESRAATLASWLAEGLSSGGTVLDVGCGWGELLLRVAAAAPAAQAVGVDLDAASLAEGTRRATDRGLADRVAFLTGEGASTGPVEVDALIAVGATQVWGSSDADYEPLPYEAGLRAMRARVRRGGRVVYGDGIWSRSPTPEAAGPLSGRLDEFVSLGELVRIAVGAGFAVVAAHEASLDEWDAFESGFNAACATWLASHSPDDPSAPGVRDRAARQQAGYLEGYRGVLGLAYLQLLAV